MSKDELTRIYTRTRNGGTTMKKERFAVAGTDDNGERQTREYNTETEAIRAAEYYFGNGWGVVRIAYLDGRKFACKNAGYNKCQIEETH